MLLTSSDLVPLDLVPLQMFRPVALVMAFREVTLEQLLARVSPAMSLQIAASFERLVATRGVALERLLARVGQAVLFQVIALFERLVATRDIALERLLTSVSAHVRLQFLLAVSGERAASEVARVDLLYLLARARSGIRLHHIHCTNLLRVLYRVAPPKT